MNTRRKIGEIFALSFICLAAFADVSPKIITGPNSYSFTSPIYSVDWNATNALIKIGASFGSPWMTGAVGYSTEDGTALAGKDYTAVSGTVGMDEAHLGEFNVPLHPSCAPTDKTVSLVLNKVISTDLIGMGGATLVIRAAPLALASPLPLTPLSFKLTAFSQGELMNLTNTKTNQTRLGTNLTQIVKSTLTKSSFASSNLLALLANSYNTNFPGGAGMAFRLGHLYVVDSTGTNVILDPATVLSLDFGEDFVSGIETQVSTSGKDASGSSGNNTEMITARAVLGYNDSQLETADGSVTKFDFSGLCVVQISTNLKNLLSKVSVNFHGTGDGIIHNQQTVLDGTVTGTVAGTSGTESGTVRSI